MTDIPPWLYAVYRANLRRNQLRPHQKPARVERPYLWLIWTARGLAYIIGRAQQRRLYSEETNATVEDVK